jgi:hypothetical protein
VTATAKVFEKLCSGGAVPVPKVSHFQQQTPRVSARRSPPKVEPRTGPDLAQQEKQHSDKAAEVASRAIMAPGGNGDGQDSAFHNQLGLTPKRKGARPASTSSMIGDLKICSSPSAVDVSDYHRLRPTTSQPMAPSTATHNIPALQILGIAYSAPHRVLCWRCECCGR